MKSEIVRGNNTNRLELGGSRTNYAENEIRNTGGYIYTGIRMGGTWRKRLRGPIDLAVDTPQKEFD